MQIMRALGKILLGLAALYVWVAPVMLAKLFADTLDLFPYLVCLLIGLGLGALVCVLLWPLVRAGLTQTRRMHRLGLAVATAIAFTPTWSIGIGIGLNRMFPRSPLVSHECQVIDWKVPTKSRSYCVVTSWRGNKIEKLDDSVIQCSAPGEPLTVLSTAEPKTRLYPHKCTPGTSLIVGTQTGLFGWPWVVAIERKL